MLCWFWILFCFLLALEEVTPRFCHLLLRLSLIAPTPFPACSLFQTTAIFLPARSSEVPEGQLAF